MQPKARSIISHSAKHHLRTLTLNMQSGEIWDPGHPDEAPFDLEQTISFLRQQDCDLIFLQEVEFPATSLPDTAIHPNYDRLKVALCDYQSWFAYPAATRPQLPFGIGLAIFSRLPLKDCFHVVLPASDVRFEFRGQWWLPAERSLIGASLTMDDQDILLLNTHLQAYFMIDSSSDRHPEQRHVLATVLKGRKTPVILGGDFNCTAQENTVADIEHCGLKTVQKREITWHRLPHVLDHLFYSPELQAGMVQVVPTTISDHDAVRAEFSLKAVSATIA